MRLSIEQTNTRQAQQVLEGNFQAESGVVATPIGVADHTLKTEAGKVSWKELAAYLPKSRKAFSSAQSARPGR